MNLFKMTLIYMDMDIYTGITQGPIFSDSGKKSLSMIMTLLPVNELFYL